MTSDWLLLAAEAERKQGGPRRFERFAVPADQALDLSLRHEPARSSRARRPAIA
jgi:hypothetical protein